MDNCSLRDPRRDKRRGLAFRSEDGRDGITAAVANDHDHATLCALVGRIAAVTAMLSAICGHRLCCRTTDGRRSMEQPRGGSRVVAKDQSGSTLSQILCVKHLPNGTRGAVPVFAKGPGKITFRASPVFAATQNNIGVLAEVRLLPRGQQLF